MTNTPTEHRPITACRVEGTPVFNTKSDRICHVQDLSIDKLSG